MSTSSLKTRHLEIDIAKGMAIALVVWGHVVSSNGAPPQGNGWYQALNNLIYLFHMPFFMFLSGVVAGIGYKPLKNWAGWVAFAQQKSVRLMPAYVLFGLAVVLGKLVASSFMHVDNLPPSVFQGVLAVFLYPSQSAAGFLWFIYTLFWFYLTLHPLMVLSGGRPALLVLVGFGLQWLPGTDLFMINRYFAFFLFFYVGVWAGVRYALFLPLIRRQGAWAFAVFAGLLGLAAFSEVPKVLVGLASVPALMWLADKAVGNRWGTLCHQVGALSFSIYLLNTICIGVAKGVGLKLVSWDGANFLMYAPALFVMGLAVPMLVRHQVFCRIPWLEKITR